MTQTVIDQTETTNFTAKEVLIAFAHLAHERGGRSRGQLIDTLDAIDGSYGLSTSLGGVAFEWDEYMFRKSERVDGRYVTTPLPIKLGDGEYEVTVVDQTGGMDEGSGASMTFKIGSQFFRKSGYYASHYGYDWDGDFEEVKPVEKTVTVYERV